MSRTLDSGDSLYTHIIACVGVDDDNSTVREFKSGTALTKETGVTVQSGNYGYDFNVKQNGSFNGFGIDMTGLSGGGVAINASNGHPTSVFIVFNSLNAVGGTADATGGTGGDTPNIRFSGTNTRQITGTLSISDQDFQATNQLAAATAASICYTFNYGSSTGRNLYLNGSKILGPTSEGGFGSSTGFYTKIGYWPGQGSIDANIAFVVWFDSELSSTDVLRLHNSLTGGGTFALLSGGATPAALAGGGLQRESGTAALSTAIPLLASAASVQAAAAAQSWPAHHAIYILDTPSGVAQPNLTGIDWALFDQTQPHSLLAPTDKGSGATTLSTGELSLPWANTAKANGQVGSLLISSTDGTTTQSPAPSSGYAPVAVSP